MIPYYAIPDLHIGPLTLHAFGLLVAIAVLFGHSQMLKYAQRHGVSVPMLANLVTPMLISGFVMAHLFVVVFYRPEDFASEWWKIWDGLSSFGGFFGALLAILVYGRIHKLKLLPYCDAILYGLVHGWIFGRMGCAVVHDHPGILTSFPLAVRFPEGHRLVGQRLDLGLLEMLYTIGMVLIVRKWLEPRMVRPGQLTVWIGLLYAPVRFVLDFLRATDIYGADARYWGLTPAQYVCLVSIAACIWLLRRQGRQDVVA